MPEIQADLSWEGASLDAAFAELEAECAQVVRGMTVKMWESILLRTPQYLGRMAASWSYSLNAPQFYDRSQMVDWDVARPRSRGNLVAVEVANADNVGSELGFKLGDTVWIANGVDHGEGYYSGDVETGAIRLRAVNLPGAPVSRTIDMIHSRYGEDVSPRAAELLKTLKIGGS